MIKSLNITTINTVAGGTDLDAQNIASNDTISVFDCICGQNYNGTTEYSIWVPQSGGMGLASTVAEKPAIKSCDDCESFNNYFKDNGYFTPDNK